MKIKKLLFLFTMMILSQKSLKAHSPTWTDGIACIIYTHCSGCHNPNGIAPFSLMSYNDVYQNRYSIAASVQSGSMPPYPANQSKRKYAHSNTLSDHEIDEIVEWVNNYAPLGDADKIPTSPTFKSNYQIPNPDYIGQIPTYTITSNKDVYRMFVIPVNNASQQTIASIEVFPGNRDVVHHALVFQDTSKVPLLLDQNDPLPGYSSFGGTGSASSKLLTVFTPGQGAFNFAPGFGAILLPNSYLLLQMHYPGGVSGQVDSTQVRIKYGSPTLRNVTTVAALNHSASLTNGPLFIPANTVKTFYNQVNVATNRTLTGIMPHMHLLGKSIKAWCVTPTNDTIHLIDIPNWDFHWQYFYQYQKPILLPAGSIVYGEATYDNTNKNFYNPNDPPQDVGVGEATTDEMFLIYMNLSNYAPGDTNIVIDTLSHYPHDPLCFQTAGFYNSNQINVNVYPNPTTNWIKLDGLRTPYKATLYNQKSMEVYAQNCEPSDHINLSHLPGGIYYLQIKTADQQIVYKRIVIQ